MEKNEVNRNSHNLSMPGIFTTYTRQMTNWKESIGITKENSNATLERLEVKRFSKLSLLLII